jgi:putative ATP-binding cassette transporter
MDVSSYRVENNPRDYKLNTLLLGRVYRLCKLYWWRRAAWKSWLALAAILALIGLASWYSQWFSFLYRDMTNALVAKSESTFWKLLTTLTIGGLSAALLSIPSTFLSSWINLDWRAWLTTHMTDRYLEKRAYYEINSEGRIDNPDQRIQEEVEPVCAAIAGIPSSLLNSFALLGVQTSILLSISPKLFWITIVLAAVQLLITIKLTQPTIRQNYNVTIAEADLRYGLLSVRDHAEVVAFYRGEKTERNNILDRLRGVVRTTMIKIRYNAFMSAITFPIDSGWAFLPYWVVVPLFFVGQLDYGSISQAQMAAGQITAAFGTVASFIPLLSNLAPHAVRLAQILEKCDEIRVRPDNGADTIALSSGDRIELHDVCLQTPGAEQRLAQNVSFTLDPGDSLLIAGQTGVGKSSMLRAMAGLWNRGTGKIVMPSPDVTLFLPQQPYMTLSDLRTQLLYPAGNRSLSNADLQAILERVNLHDLAETHGGFDVAKDWRRILSLGEQQRIGFARVLTNKPGFLFLDEATSAVDVATETMLYGLVRRAGCTVVSVGHRPSLFNCHNRVLHLMSGGKWSLEAVTQPQT